MLTMDIASKRDKDYCPRQENIGLNQRTNDVDMDIKEHQIKPVFKCTMSMQNAL